MLTEFGRALRKLRIDRGERLFDMAQKLGKSPAFLSAVETGRKSPPQGLAEEIVRVYGLKGAAAAEVRQAADRSRQTYKVEARTPAARDTAALLARKFNTLSNEQLAEIQRILQRKK